MPRRRNRAQRLRTSVELLPRHTREAMLAGIASNQIIVGAYTDRGGGVCPMLAAHRIGGRTDFPSFARAWDEFTRARRPRQASRREIGVLRTYLEMSLLSDESGGESLVQIADGIRRRRGIASRPSDQHGAAPPPPARDVFRVRDLRPRRRRSREPRGIDLFEATIAADAEPRVGAPAGRRGEATASRRPHPAA